MIGGAGYAAESKAHGSSMSMIAHRRGDHRWQESARRHSFMQAVCRRAALCSLAASRCARPSIMGVRSTAQMANQYVGIDGSSEHWSVGRHIGGLQLAQPVGAVPRQGSDSGESGGFCSAAGDEPCGEPDHHRHRLFGADTQLNRLRRGGIPGGRHVDILREGMLHTYTIIDAVWAQWALAGGYLAHRHELNRGCSCCVWRYIAHRGSCGMGPLAVGNAQTLRTRQVFARSRPSGGIARATTRRMRRACVAAGGHVAEEPLEGRAHRCTMG